MNRLTKKIKGANNYCEFELKNASYKELFDLKNNKEIEDYVSCDLTLAIDELGRQEDLTEQVGCSFDVINKAMQYGFYTGGEFYGPDTYDIKYAVDKDGLSFARLEVYEDISRINDNIYTLKCIIDVWTDNYMKTWWLKEDKSE